MRTSIKIALFVVFFLAVAGIGLALYLYNLKPADLHNLKPDYVMTSSELQNAFEIDEIGASAKYLNKIIEVSGTIASSGPGYENTFNIGLRTESLFSNVICTFQNTTDTIHIQIGEGIIIRGKCSGFLMDVLMNDCVVIDK